MSQFFQRAPAQDAFQKRFLEAMAQGRHVVASFPLMAAPAQPQASLYALAAMMSHGMAVAVTASPAQIRRNMEYFRAAGYPFPDVAALDGTQMPHEEREIERLVNHNKIKLLYVTPDRFASLTFLELMVHAQISFLIVEEAERLLPVMPGYTGYKKFYEEGLSLLRKLPPTALLIPPMPPARMKELSDRLNLHPFQVMQTPPLIEPIDLQVRMLLSEYQKYRHLLNVLTGNSDRGKLGRITAPGSVLIQTAYPAQAEKLGASLIDYGFESVWISHYKKSPSEQAQALEVANTKLNTILVSAGLELRHWAPSPEARPRLIYWTPPTSMEEVLMQVFRQGAGMQGGYGDAHFMKGLIFYTKEDFEATLRRLQGNRLLDDKELREKVRALRHLRTWLLSEGCRLQTLAAFFEGSSTIELPPCGRCDRCREEKQGASGLRRLLARWLF